MVCSLFVTLLGKVLLEQGRVLDKFIGNDNLGRKDYPFNFNLNSSNPRGSMRASRAQWGWAYLCFKSLFSPTIVSPGQYHQALMIWNGWSIPMWGQVPRKSSITRTTLPMTCPSHWRARTKPTAACNSSRISIYRIMYSLVTSHRSSVRWCNFYRWIYRKIAWTGRSLVH